MSKPVYKSLKAWATLNEQYRIPIFNMGLALKPEYMHLNSWSIFGSRKTALKAKSMVKDKGVKKGIKIVEITISFPSYSKINKLK